MHVDPTIAALRTDRGPQRHAQAAMCAAFDAWQEERGAGDVITELAQFGDGVPLEVCPALERVFTAPDEAERLMALFSRHMCDGMRANPVGHPPFHNGFDGNAASILLARRGRAQLMLQSREPGKSAEQSHFFTDGLRYDAVLAGEASARIVRLVRLEGGRARFASEPIALRRGGRFAFDLSSETLVFGQVERRLVVLRLMRMAELPEPSHEYDATDGRLLSKSAGTIATSRQEATVTLLGRMGREDAAPAMAEVALGEGDASLRWQALRECLALDTATGFTTLVKLARRADDPLAADAGALRARLLEMHPQLQELEDRECPA